MELKEPFKIDKNGLYYIDSKDVKIEKFNFNEIVKSYGQRRDFYHIEGVSDYIIKDTSKLPLLFNTYRNKKMLENFQKKEGMVENIDFPVGYFLEEKGIKTIVPIYDGAVSIHELIKLYQFDDLKKYYQHDDNDVNNLISLCLDILDLVEIMYNADIVYRDISAGNFVVYNNTTKVIDFEPGYVIFTKKKDKYYEILLHNYAVLVDYIWHKYGFKEVYYNPGKSFNEERIKVKSLIDKKRG